MKPTSMMTQIINHLGDYAVRIQKPSWNKRTVSLISDTDTAIDSMNLPQSTTLNITSTPYTIVIRAYNVVDIMRRRGKSDEERYEDNTISSQEYDIECIQDITLHYIFESILHIDISHYSTMSTSSINKMIKENNLAHRFIDFLSNYTHVRYQEDHVDSFISYVLQCSKKNQQELLALHIFDIPTIFMYVPSYVFKTLVTYIATTPFSPTSISIVPQSTHTLHKKRVRLSTSPTAYTSFLPYVYFSTSELSPSYHTHITSITPQYNQEIYQTINYYLPQLIILLCSTQKNSKEHDRSFLLFYSIVLYYCDREHIPIPLRTAIYSLYQDDHEFLEYIERENISPEIISFALALEYSSNIHAKQYIYDIHKDTIYTSISLQYGIFWIRLLASPEYSYSRNAFYIMTSFISSFSTIKFSVFERLYTIAYRIEHQYADSDILDIFTDSKMREAIEFLSEQTFIDTVNSLSSIKNRKSFSILLKKRFLNAYYYH